MAKREFVSFYQIQGAEVNFHVSDYWRKLKINSLSPGVHAGATRETHTKKWWKIQLGLLFFHLHPPWRSYSDWTKNKKIFLNGGLSSIYFLSRSYWILNTGRSSDSPNWTEFSEWFRIRRMFVRMYVDITLLIKRTALRPAARIRMYYIAFHFIFSQKIFSNFERWNKLSNNILDETKKRFFFLQNLLG